MIYNGDCLAYLRSSEKKYQCIIADIPDNIGYDYIGFKDSIPDYIPWVQKLIALSLERCRVFWLSYNQRWDLEIKKALNTHGWNYKQIIWRYTFGQYNDNEEASGYRPIIRLHLGQLNFDAIRVPSKRMEMGDKRAAGPRVPDDVYEFPRVVGNANERRSWHPTQHPEALIERMLKLSCKKGESVLDLCLGSGTTGIVANRLGLSWDGCEISPFYYKMLTEMFNEPVVLHT